MNTVKMSGNATSSNTTKRLSAFVQPIVNTCSGQTVGLEVLLRYRLDKQGGYCYLSPEKMLGELNGTDAFNAVTVGLFNVVSAHMQAINNSSLSFITFNVIPPQLRCADFLAEVVKFKRTMPPGVNLILEMVEGYGSHLNEHIRQAIRQLSRHNVFFAIDDFGNKSLALRYIKHPPFSLLKLDRSLAAVAQGKLCFEKTIKSMVTITNQLDVKLVVEGVETEKQLTLLQRCGVQHFQGFFYAKPCHIKDYFLNEKEVC